MAKDELPFDLTVDSEEGCAKNPEEEDKIRSILEDVYTEMQEEKEELHQTIYHLTGTIDRLYRDLLDSDLEVVKWRQSVIKHLQPYFGELLYEDILNNLHSVEHYMDDPGFSYYVKHFGHKNPTLHYAKGIHRRQLFRMMKGISVDSDIVTYSISLRGGLGMLKKAMDHVYECVRAMSLDDVFEDNLEQSLDLLDELVKAYDRECSYLHGLREEFTIVMDNTEFSARMITKEVSYLYRVLRDNKVEIPTEGHSISLQPFADEDDPSREEYTGEYEVPDWLLSHDDEALNGDDD